MKMDEIINNYIDKTIPESRSSKEFDKEYYLSRGLSEEEISKMVLTLEDTREILGKLGIKKDSSFYKFVSIASFVPDTEFVEMYSLEKILEEKINPFWGDEYPNISDRFLRLSSIEGEASYFYDIERDNIFDVGWEDMYELIDGTIVSDWENIEEFLIENIEFNK